METNRTLATVLAALVVSAGLVGVVAATDDTTRTTGDEPRDGALEHALDALAERYDLTDEQVGGLEELIRAMRENGASTAEIREAVRDRLVEFGVPEAALPDADRDRLDRREGRSDRRGGDGRVAWMVEYLGLTDEQVAQLERTVTALREAGAMEAEGRAAVLGLPNPFTRSLLLFSVALLLYALASNPLVWILLGFRRGLLGLGIGGFAFLPDLFAAVAVTVLLHQSYR